MTKSGDFRSCTSRYLQSRRGRSTSARVQAQLLDSRIGWDDLLGHEGAPTTDEDLDQLRDILTSAQARNEARAAPPPPAQLPLSLVQPRALVAQSPANSNDLQLELVSTLESLERALAQPCTAEYEATLRDLRNAIAHGLALQRCRPGRQLVRTTG